MNEELFKEAVEALRELLDADEFFRLMRSETAARELRSARRRARTVLAKVEAQYEEEN